MTDDGNLMMAPTLGAMSFGQTTAPSPDHLPVGAGDRMATSPECIVAAIRAAETPANSEAILPL